MRGTDRPNRLTPWAVAAFAGFALVYAAYPSFDYYFDGLVFAGAIESVAAGSPAARLFHPHHLLYCPAALLGYKALVLGGLRIRAWLFLQLMSAACGVGTLFVFRRLARRMGAPSPIADAGMVALGACYVFWDFSTQGDTTIPTTLALLMLLSVLANTAERRGGPTPGSAAWLGGLLGAAALLHESAVIFAPTAIWVLGRTGSRRDRYRLPAALLGTAGLVIGTGYLAACRFGLGLTHPVDMLVWARGYFGAEALTGYAPHYGRWAPGNLLDSVKAFGEAFVGPAADANPWRPRTAAAVAGLGIMLAGWRLTRDRHAAPRRAVLEGIALWLATNAIFFTWWMPGHTRFWALALPVWMLILLLGLAAVAKVPAARARATVLAWAVAATVVLLVGVGPFARETRPSANRWLPITDRLVKATAPDSLVIISGIGAYTSLKVYIPYFATRYMLVLDWRFADAAVPPAAAIDRLRTYLAALKRDRAVYVLSEVLDPSLDAPFADNHGVTPAMRRGLFESFHPRPGAVLEPGLTLLRL